MIQDAICYSSCVYLRKRDASEIKLKASDANDIVQFSINKAKLANQSLEG